MYLLDSNILRHLWQGHEGLIAKVESISPHQVAIPSVVYAEVIRGRAEQALKAEAKDLVQAHRYLSETRQALSLIQILDFDEPALQAFEAMAKKHSKKKRHADMQIAAIVKSGGHVLVTRNHKHFADLLSHAQLENWIDG